MTYLTLSKYPLRLLMNFNVLKLIARVSNNAPISLCPLALRVEIMKRFLPILVLVLAAGWLASSLRPQKNIGEADLVSFSRLPVLVNGRIKPLDTVARTSLLMLAGPPAR